MRKLWLIVVVVVVVPLAFWALGIGRPVATLDVVKPKVQTLRVYVEEQAITELPHDHLVSMPIAGWLQPIMLREGDPVAVGQVIARLEAHDLQDRALQAQQRVAELETRIEETSDHRLERNALVEVEATVKAIDETVKAAEAKLEAAKATFDFTEAEVHRLENLVEVDSAAGREFRQAQLEYRKARADYQSDLLELAALKTLAAVSYIGPKFIKDYIDLKSFKLDAYAKQLERARAELKIAQRNLERAELRSPIDGVVLHRHQTRRQFLPAGTPLLTLGRLDDMEVTAEVLTERATRITPGDPVEIFGEALPDGPVPGNVLRVFPAGFTKISSLGVEQQRVNVTTKLEHRPERLGVGFRVYVRIFYDEAHDALTLPRRCLFRGSTGVWQAMTVRGGKTELRQVEIGLMNDDAAQIISGLRAEDIVVLNPSREIVSGLRVRTTPQAQGL
ncbi:MAG: efflux RND transporter periplasmic adaptor subunit [Planctomycetota bacterium]|jgi:HlyD family secretion protein